MVQAVKTFISGFLMGAADVVPGVSGGTVALVVGIYERLIGSIRAGSSALGSLIKADFGGMRRHLSSVEWGFLVALLAGILTAVLTLAHYIGNQLEKNPVILAAIFFGLVLGSVVVASRLIRTPQPSHLTAALLVGIVLFVLLGLSQDRTVDDPSLVIYFGAGALAICAMILPGISGSLILLLVGMYEAVLAAVNDRDWVTVVIFALGAVVGLALFSQILYAALRRAHDWVMAILLGLMLGSLRILWPWPHGVGTHELGAPDGQVMLAVFGAVAGFVVVVAIARLADPS